MGTNLIPSNRDHLIRELPVPLSGAQAGALAAGTIAGFIAKYPGTVRGFQIYARDSGSATPTVQIQKNSVAIGSATFATVTDGAARSAVGTMTSNDYVAGDRIEIVVSAAGTAAGNLLVDTDIVQTF